MFKQKTFRFLLIPSCIFCFGMIIGKSDLFPLSTFDPIAEANASETPAPAAKPKGRNRENQLQIFESFSPKSDVAFIGDSITDGARWNEFFPDVRLINRGVSSDKTSDVLLRMNSIISAQPAKAFIMIGINDISENVATADILKNYAEIVKKLAEAGSEIYIQSTIQCDVDICGKSSVAAVNQLNDGLKQLAQKYHYNFVDLGDLSSRKGLDAKFTIDGIHLDVDGYRYWIQQISALVMSK